MDVWNSRATEGEVEEEEEEKDGNCIGRMKGEALTDAAAG